ncbi:glycosyltransferase family 9 protein [Legionella lansingensis]|nr:glycosyltransferase family 9 protein [Legionella lansingensis]
MTLPSLQALKSAGFDLQLYGQKWIFDLLQSLPAKLFYLPKSIRLARNEISKNLATNTLLFTNSFSSALITYLAKKKAVSYKNTIRNVLLYRSIDKERHLHEVEYFWKIAKLAALTWLPDASWPTSIPKSIHLPLNPISELKVEERLKRDNITDPFIIFCPSATGAAKQGAYKIWPHWRELSEQINQLGMTSIMCPGPLEEAYCKQLLPKTKLVAGLNLSELAAMLKRASLVVSNDSGPMHIATAVGATVLGIFGSTNPIRTAPWGGSYIGELGKWPSSHLVLAQIAKMLNL